MAEMNTTIIIITIHLHILKIAIVHLFVSSNIIIMYYWQNVHLKLALRRVLINIHFSTYVSPQII